MKKKKFHLPAKPQAGQATFCPFSIANSRIIFASLSSKHLKCFSISS